MDLDKHRQPRLHRFLGLTGRATLYVLAAIGLFCVVGGMVLKLVLSPLYERRIVRSAFSPDRTAVAELEVTTGGATVWTTRIRLRPVGGEGWTVYQAGDSRFEPSMAWAAKDTLVISLPCDRFDHLSNPDDWGRSDPAARRLKVRFTYPKDCAATK